MQNYQNSQDHLIEELERLDLIINLQILRQRYDPAYTGFNEFRGMFISEQEIDVILKKDTINSDKDSKQAASEIQKVLSAIEHVEKQIASHVTHALKHDIYLPFVYLAKVFHLTPFDLDALLICLAPEINVRYEKLYAYLQNDVSRKRPSVDLILNLLCNSRDEKLQARRRLMSEAPLFKYDLITNQNNGYQANSNVMTRFLAIDNHIVNCLLDINSLDSHVASFARLIKPNIIIDNLILPSEIKENFIPFFKYDNLAFFNNENKSVWGFVFYGPDGSGKRSTAEALCKWMGINLLFAYVPQMVRDDSLIESSFKRLFREARLRNSAVYLDDAAPLLKDDDKAVSIKHTLLKVVENFPGTVFIGAREPLDINSRLHKKLFFNVAFPFPDYSLRKQLWQTFLANYNCRISRDVDIDALADKFHFTAGRIYKTISEAHRFSLMQAPDKECEISSDHLYQACQCQSSSKLSSLAKKITPIYTWSDIVLPDDKLIQLKDVCTHARYRQKVFSEWGFDQKISLGKGLSVLFAGPSGTGKTMAAEIIAGELRLDLYKIDLSCVVSKYIGETEKNLSTIFQEADESNAILFFDEADAIFGKRSEVKDSHDRYANIEINYLLQRMEEYEGIVILASNFQKNIDEAFTRRLRFIIEFPFPDADYRLTIWKKIFPQSTPLDRDIDFTFLANKLKITGGNIKNIALGAAFFAAQNSGVVNMEHLIHAVRREFQKMGRLCVKADFEQYFELIENEEAL